MSVHQRIEIAIRACEQHLQAMRDLDIELIEVERYLVAGLVVLIVSEYEEHLEAAFCGRADRCGDTHAANFIKASVAKKFRSPDLGKINQTLKRFDQSCLDTFAAEIENSREHAAWDSIMKARHAVVHKQGTLNLTFRELLEKYEQSKPVIANVERALSIYLLGSESRRQPA